MLNVLPLITTSFDMTLILYVAYMTLSMIVISLSAISVYVVFFFAAQLIAHYCDFFALNQKVCMVLF